MTPAVLPGPDPLGDVHGLTVLSKGLRRLLRLRAGLAPAERTALEGSHAAVKGWLAAARRSGRPGAPAR